MPLYVFRCPDCRREFEMLLKPKEHPGTCPHCMAHPELHKQITAPAGFQLRGDGFYKPTSNKESDE